LTGGGGFSQLGRDRRAGSLRAIGVRLQAARLIQNVVHLAVDRSDVRGLGGLRIACRGGVECCRHRFRGVHRYRAACHSGACAGPAGKRGARVRHLGKRYRCSARKTRRARARACDSCRGACHRSAAGSGDGHRQCEIRRWRRRSGVAG
jgi:hypothetical protein